MIRVSVVPKMRRDKGLHMRNIPVLIFLIFNFGLLFGCSKPPSDMVYVPKGEFIMGSDEVDKDAKAQQYGERKPWYANEKPKRKVYLKGFYIDKYEVTNVLYADFVKAANHNPPDYWIDGNYPPDIAEYPVVMVDWSDAKAYCEWRSRRLPTEAEWEKAARGTDGRRFPWGDEFDGKKVDADGQQEEPSPIGTFEEGKSPYGVYDMAGNVYEWVEDWYKAYPGNDYNDNDYGEKFRVVRSNGWGGMGHYNLQMYARTSYRNASPPDGKFNDIGFRCAK